jgi:uncharacterized protein YqgC (DUF456 family)
MVAAKDSGVWESIQSWPGWGGVGVGLAWIVTLCLMLAGLIGCVLPILPGHLLMFIGAVGHRLMLGREDSGLEWWSFVVLALLMTISQTFEFLSGAAGARWFGGTRWGAAGALIGGIVGLFFFPFGLLLGPLIGAVLFEMIFAGKTTRPATVSGVGSVVGTLAGMGFKIVVGLLMLAWFLVDALFIG